MREALMLLALVGAIWLVGLSVRDFIEAGRDDA